MGRFEEPPFFLDADALAWVEGTFASLGEDEKLRQLFNLRLAGQDPAEIARVRGFAPGGITRISGPDPDFERALVAGFNAAAPAPLLVSADLEGSRMSLAGGIEVLNPLGLAAVDDVEATTRISRIMAEEARARGINWSFTPVLDINAAFRSAIVATRGFGSDVAAIERHALAQMRAFQAAGVAAAVKHWPGEGYDDRDQHLVTTINPLSLDEWEQTFGRLYRAAIEAGAMSVMSAHIAFPAFVHSLAPDARIEAFRPASVSRVLNQVLLRERLGFNGLIVSDATGMAGLGSWSKRAEYLPEIVAAGCDVILFSDDPGADLAHLRAALANGRLTWARVDDAVRRQLAMKAALGLHKPGVALAERDVAADAAYARSVTRRAPTLVKDTQNLLPLDPARHRRMLVVSSDIIFPFRPDPVPFALPDMLKARGFEVTLYRPETVIDAQRFDVILYLFGDETLLTRGRIFLDWLKLTGHFGKAMISFGYPYMLYDAPRVPTYINAYSTMESMQEAVAEALLGNIPWNRHSPVDPFCGLEDARY